MNGYAHEAGEDRGHWLVAMKDAFEKGESERASERGRYLVEGTRGQLQVVVDGIHQAIDRRHAELALVTVQRLQRRSTDEGDLLHDKSNRIHLSID